MDARIAAMIVAVGGLCLPLTANGASYRTQNFVVTADSPSLAREVSLAAETYRRELSRQWLGYDLKPWSAPVPIQVNVASHLGAGGVTSFIFESGIPKHWQMMIQGSRQRVLDSVLPHEVSHTVFATHFGKPLPRWADEGACTTVEHNSEKQKQHKLLLRYLTTDRGIPFNKMLRMKEYPRDIMTLYSQGFSVSQYLIAHHGKRTFVKFLEDAMSTGNWDLAINKYYPFTGASDLQVKWITWLAKGSPPVSAPATLATFIATGKPADEENPADVGWVARRR